MPQIVQLSACFAMLAAACSSVQDFEGLSPSPLEGLDASAGIIVEAGATAREVDETILRYELAIDVELDLDRLAGVAGVSAGLSARSYRGDPSKLPLLGGASGLENPETDQLSVAWLGWSSPDAAAQLRVGLLDANDRFAALDRAEGFFHAAVATSPTILGMPTAPESAPGLEIEGELDGWTWAGGVYDGSRSAPVARFVEPDAVQPGGWFGICELGHAWPGVTEVPAGRLAVGAWGSDAPQEDLDGRRVAGASGGYALGEARVWTARSQRAGLDIFGLVGGVAESVVATRRHAWLGTALERERRGSLDRVGLMISHAALEPSFGAASAGETTLEVFGRLGLGADSALGASVQWVEHPGGDRREGQEVVLGLRFEQRF